MSLIAKLDFGNEAGDDADPQELTSYFVEQSMFREFVDSRNKILIATAKKGVGKSALIQWLHHRISVTDDSAITVKCRGADLARSRFKLQNPLDGPSDYIRDWMIRICAIINRSLASKIKLALTDDSITLVESAELDGFKQRNLVGCLLDRFSRILDRAQPDKLKASDDVELLKRVPDRKLWILIDDLDATFQNTPSECLALGTFFSACRYLTQDVVDVCFRVTMRTDVWPIVRRYDEAQDKTDQYVREIVWSRIDFRKLLFKRIKSQSELLEIKLPNLPPYMEEEEREEAVLQLAFVPKMPWGERDAYTYRVIYTLSYHRPRWAIQLCKLAQRSAVDRGGELISKNDIDVVWGDYGHKRIADLVSEHKHQCANVEELINGFRGCDRLMSREGLLQWIKNRISNHVTPVIEGVPVKSPLVIAHFIYRIGFIVARSQEIGSYEHYHFADMPDFLTSRTNTDFEVQWEIHPCYREALDIESVNEAQRIKKGIGKEKRKAAETKSLLKPISAQPSPQIDSKTFDPITPKILASKLGMRPAEILNILIEMNVFVGSSHTISDEIVKRVIERVQNSN